MTPGEGSRRRVYRSHTIRRRRGSALAIALLLALAAVFVRSGVSGGREVVRYDRAAAAAYADRWALGNNPAYWSSPDSDCANFVSQCVNAGGLRPLSTSAGGWHANGTEFPSIAWCNVDAQWAAWAVPSVDGTGPYIARMTEDRPADWARGDIVYLGNTVDGKTEWQHVIICVGKRDGEWIYSSHTVAHRRRTMATWYPSHFTLIRYCHITDSVSYE